MSWFVAKEAMALGFGGIKYIHELTGISRPTIIRGCNELKGNEKLNVFEGVRAPGAGRPSVDVKNQKLDEAILKIMHETTAGDLMRGKSVTLCVTTK